MLLTESKVNTVLTEGLKYHLETKTPLYENIFRPGSEEYFNTIRQARLLMNKGLLTELCFEDIELLHETEVGEYGEYNGQKVPLDFPMLEEIVMVIPSAATSWREASQEPLVMKMGQDKWMDLAGKSQAAGGLGYKTNFTDVKNFVGDVGTGTVTFSEDDEVQMPTVLKYMEGEQVRYKVIAGQDILASLLQDDPNPEVWVVDITQEAEQPLQELLNRINEAKLDPAQKKELVRRLIKAASGPAAAKSVEQILSDIEKKLSSASSSVGVKYAHGVRVNEAKYQGKEVALNKPKRGGPKKFYVYTRNPKTGKIIKVNFGDTTGLSAKINNKEARVAFSKRHNCPTKKDKTKAGYWSCRLPRYASLLGLKSSFGGYW